MSCKDTIPGNVPARRAKAYGQIGSQCARYPYTTYSNWSGLEFIQLKRRKSLADDGIGGGPNGFDMDVVDVNQSADLPLCTACRMCFNCKVSQCMRQFLC